MNDYFPPSDNEGGWRVAYPSDVGMVTENLDEAFEFIQGNTKNGGLVVVKDGWLVYERYFGKGHREMVPDLASCGKSFTSIAMGILMDEMADGLAHSKDNVKSGAMLVGSDGRMYRTLNREDIGPFGTLGR